IPEKIQQSGTRYVDLVRFLAQRGDYGQGDPEAHIKLRLEALEQGQPNRLVLHPHTKQGNRAIEVLFEPMSTGHLLFAYGDLSELERARSALAESNAELSRRVGEAEGARRELAGANRELLAAQARLSVVFENPSIGVAIGDLEGRYRLVNLRFSQLLG